METDMENKRSIEELTELIQSEIRYCPYCQTYEEGQVVWIFGNRVDLDELMDDFEVPEQSREELVKGLSCPNCRAEISRPTDVGIRYDYEVEYDNKIAEAKAKYSGNLFDFSFYLRNFPYLGASHPIGKTILDEIPKFPQADIRDQEWYRARRIEAGKKLSQEYMFPPDPDDTYIPEGRYNHTGQSYWYLASTKEAAAAEAVKKGERMAWVQKIRIELLENLLDVRPLEADDDRVWTPEGELKEISLVGVALIFSDDLVQWVDRDATVKPEYHVPRFVADAAKHAGMSGIIFRSSRHYDQNIVLFDRHSPLEFLGDPDLVCLPEHLAKLEHGLFYADGFPILFPSRL